MTSYTIFSCFECKTKIEFNVKGKKFCTLKCSHKFHREKLLRKYREKSGVDPNWKKKERICQMKQCLKLFLPKTGNQKYCSRKCSSTSTTFNYIHEFSEELPNNQNYCWLKLRVVVFDRDNFTCQYCGRSPKKDKKVVLHIDHKIPKKKGGNDKIDNLITSCAECNLGKSDLLLEYWKTT